MGTTVTITAEEIGHYIDGGDTITDVDKALEEAALAANASGNTQILTINIEPSEDDGDESDEDETEGDAA